MFGGAAVFDALSVSLAYIKGGQYYYIIEI